MCTRHKWADTYLVNGRRQSMPWICLSPCVLLYPSSCPSSRPVLRMMIIALASSSSSSSSSTSSPKLGVLTAVRCIHIFCQNFSWPFFGLPLYPSCVPLAVLTSSSLFSHHEPLALEDDEWEILPHDHSFFHWDDEGQVSLSMERRVASFSSSPWNESWVYIFQSSEIVLQNVLNFELWLQSCHGLLIKKQQHLHAWRSLGGQYCLRRIALLWELIMLHPKVFKSIIWNVCFKGRWEDRVSFHCSQSKHEREKKVLPLSSSSSSRTWFLSIPGNIKLTTNCYLSLLALDNQEKNLFWQQDEPLPCRDETPVPDSF